MDKAVQAFFLAGILAFASGQWYDQLFDDLQSNLKPTIPVTNLSRPLDVDMSITVLKITAISDDIVEVNAWVTLNWRDNRLAWQPNRFNNINSISIPVDKLWTPDIKLYNAAPDGEKRQPARATVLSNGDIAYVPPIIYRLYCSRDIQPERPVRECKMKFGSWSYNGLQLDLRTSATSMDMSEYIRDNSVEVISTRAVRSVQYYPCCPEPYPDIHYNFRFREFPARRATQSSNSVASPAATRT